MRFSILPFLVVFLTALMAMPLDIFQVCAWNCGTEKLSPWQRATSAVSRSVLGLWQRGVVWCRGLSLGDLVPLGAAAGMLALAWSGHLHPHTMLAIPVLGHLKQFRQNAADLDRELAANAERALAISKEIRELNAAAASGEMTDEQRAKLASLQKQQTSNAELRAALLKEKAGNAQLLAEAEAANEAERQQPAAPDADADAGRRAAQHVSVRDRAEDDPKRGFRTHTEQLAAIMKAGQTGVIDPRLKPLAAAGSDEQGGHTNPHGGFLLAPAFSPDLLSVQPEDDPTAGRTRSVPMTADRVVFNARVDKNHTTSVSGGLTVSRTPQTVAASVSRQEFEQVELVAHDLCGVGYATNRILQTSPVSFLSLLQSGFRDEFSSKLLDERLNGSGNAEYEGVINADCTIVVNKETGQAADTITFENVNKMRARQWRYGRSIWLANNDTLPQVTTLYMPIGTGGERVPIYAPGTEDAPQGTLLGRPIFFTEFCQKVGDKGDIINAVWSEYLEGTLGGMQESSSIHVRFLNREETFLFVVMNDAKPWWRSALTPKYSTVTLSPFVVLQAR